MNRQWTATATPTAPGWMVVPAELNAHEASTWVDDRHDELRTLWTSEWREEFSPGVRDILEAAVASRPGDVVLDALCWPFRGPAVARVSVRVGPSTPLSAWIDAGFDVEAYDGAAIGPGMQCIDTTVLEGESEKVALLAAHYLFDDGDRAVQVMVEPTFFHVFAAMAPGLHGFVDSLEVHEHEGVPFAAQPIPGLVRGETEEWQVQESG